MIHAINAAAALHKIRAVHDNEKNDEIDRDTQVGNILEDYYGKAPAERKLRVSPAMKEIMEEDGCWNDRLYAVVELL